jgi:UDP-3-O-[3-hydroxymyristoyl] glucosamine N-acyltransferase
MIRLSELAQKVGVRLIGEDAEIEGMCALSAVKGNHLVFAETERDYAEAVKTRAAAILTAFCPSGTPEKPVLYTQSARAAFARCLALFGRRGVPVWVETRADYPRYVDREAKVSDSATIGPFAVVECGARIGPRSVVYPYCYVGVNSEIGADCILYPGAVVMDGVRIGDGTILQAGAVVGSDGFGFFREEPTGTPQKIPQVGGCEIGARVEIGANSCVDRATMEQTKIGDDSKLDNLVQVAHNVSIGRGALIAAQTGVPGSVTLGERVTAGGQAAFNDHITVGDDSIVAARSAVFSSLPPRSLVSGYPAQPHREALRILAVYSRLPDLLDRVRRIEKRLGMGPENSR